MKRSILFNSGYVSFTPFENCVDASLNAIKSVLKRNKHFSPSTHPLIVKQVQMCVKNKTSRWEIKWVHFWGSIFHVIVEPHFSLREDQVEAVSISTTIEVILLIQLKVVNHSVLSIFFKL